MSFLLSMSRRAEKYKKLETSGHSRSCGKSTVLPRKCPALRSHSQSSAAIRLCTPIQTERRWDKILLLLTNYSLWYLDLLPSECTLALYSTCNLGWQITHPAWQPMPLPFRCRSAGRLSSSADLSLLTHVLDYGSFHSCLMVSFIIYMNIK